MWLVLNLLCLLASKLELYGKKFGIGRVWPMALHSLVPPKNWKVVSVCRRKSHKPQIKIHILAKY